MCATFLWGLVERGLRFEERLVRPTDKTAKCWRYDISHGAMFGPVVLDTPIGGKEVSITLKNRYRLEWRQYGAFWFLEVQGRTQ